MDREFVRVYYPLQAEYAAAFAGYIAAPVNLAKTAGRLHRHDHLGSRVIHLQRHDLLAQPVITRSIVCEPHLPQCHGFRVHDMHLVIPLRQIHPKDDRPTFDTRLFRC